MSQLTFSRHQIALGFVPSMSATVKLHEANFHCIITSHEEWVSMRLCIWQLHKYFKSWLTGTRPKPFLDEKWLCASQYFSSSTNLFYDEQSKGLDKKQNEKKLVPLWKEKPSSPIEFEKPWAWKKGIEDQQHHLSLPQWKNLLAMRTSNTARTLSIELEHFWSNSNAFNQTLRLNAFYQTLTN